MADNRATLTELAEEFWTWRVVNQPSSQDDVTRVERPPGWRSDWSAAAISARRQALADFAHRHEALDLSDEPVAVQVDGRLLGSALARVHWELELLRGWQRNPWFYLDQSLGPIYQLMLRLPPFDDERAAAIVDGLHNVAVVLSQARENLTEVAAPFASYVLRTLSEVDGSVGRAMATLAPELPDPYAAALPEATRAATEAVDGFRYWLTENLASMGDAQPIGPDALAYFLHRVALLPYPAQRVRETGRQEWDRAVAMEAVLRTRHRAAATPPWPADVAELVARQADDELAVRRFLDAGLLSQPDTLRHYRFAARPAYLEPLTWLGVCDDLTAQERVDDDAVRYVSPPGPELPYFDAAAALDPRTAIVHEGVHAQQVAIGWRHDNPARRRYYDSLPIEGIAFYHEELMFLAGLFDDNPASAVFVANAMRLRALRVEVDIALALGDLSIDAAADRLADAVPMDRQTAWEEAVFFAGNPGQGLSYQLGKLQVLDLLNTSARGQRDSFDLQAFHDRLWREGNVPLVLQRWESLGLTDQLDEADRLAAR